MEVKEKRGRDLHFLKETTLSPRNNGRADVKM